MKPRQTIYGGTRFKSLLEAKWAVFFDYLGLKWRYEHRQFRLGYYPEHRQTQDARSRDASYGLYRGYRFDNELVYTPDFLLPELDLLVEVKPSVLTRTEEVKIGRLAYRTCRNFLVLIGFERFILYYWMDLDYPQELEDLADALSPGRSEIVQAALKRAKEFRG